MELGGELHLGLNKLVLLVESMLGQANAKSELATLVDLVLVLHVGVHVTKEQLFIVFVRESQTHALVWRIALQFEIVVCLHDVV